MITSRIPDQLSAVREWVASHRRKGSEVGRNTRIGLGVLLALSLLAWIGTYRVVTRARRESNIVRRSLLVRLSLEDVLSTLKDAETGQRGYLLTRDAAYLEPYRAAQNSIQQQVAALKKLTADNAAGRTRVQEIARLSDAKMADLNATIALSHASGFPPAIALVRTGRGRQLMAQIRATAVALESAQLALLAGHSAALDRATGNLNDWFLLGYALFLLTAASIYLTVHKHTVQTERAERELRRVNAGLEQQVEERTTSLREKEERLRLAQDTACVASWELDIKGSRLLGSATFNNFFALAPGEWLGLAEWMTRLHAADREKVEQSISNLLRGEELQEVEFRIRHADGRLRWHLAKGAGFRAADGEVDRALGVTIDITERKEAEAKLRGSEQENRALLATLRHSEEELRALAGSLLEVQEDERRRIARDLHDDITQELAAISIDIGTLAKSSPAAGGLIPAFRSLQERITQVCSVVRHVSHGLHPSMLEDLGLSAALESFCEEFSEMEGIRVDFEADEDDDMLSAAEASCLYRIAQESLRNVAKHANASHVKVELRSNAEMVRLSVRDNGVGIPANSSGTRRQTGLGLVSMKERMRLINGTLSVISSPGEGTQVIGCVPVRVIGRETIAHTTGR